MLSGSIIDSMEVANLYIRSLDLQTLRRVEVARIFVEIARSVKCLIFHQCVLLLESLSLGSITDILMAFFNPMQPGISPGFWILMSNEPWIAGISGLGNVGE